MLRRVHAPAPHHAVGPRQEQVLIKVDPAKGNATVVADRDRWRSLAGDIAYVAIHFPILSRVTELVPGGREDFRLRAAGGELREKRSG